MEKPRIRHFLILLGLPVGVMLLTLAFHDPLLRGYADLFLRDDGMAKSDAVVVAGGHFTSRLGKAVEHYMAGYVDRIAIFVLPVPDNPVVRRFYPGETGISRKVLEEGYGITEYDLLTYETGVTSTYEEALAMRDYCRKEQLDSLTVVTDAFHSFRAGYVYEKWAGDVCRIAILPVYPKNYATARWWRSEWGIKNYVLEPLKLLNDYWR